MKTQKQLSSFQQFVCKIGVKRHLQKTLCCSAPTSQALLIDWHQRAIAEHIQDSFIIPEIHPAVKSWTQLPKAWMWKMPWLNHTKPRTMLMWSLREDFWAWSPLKIFRSLKAQSCLFHNAAFSKILLKWVSVPKNARLVLIIMHQGPTVPLKGQFTQKWNSVTIGSPI